RERDLAAEVAGARTIAALALGERSRLASYREVAVRRLRSVGVDRRIERPEFLLGFQALAVSDDVLDAVDLEIHRLRAVDDRVVLGLLIADVDPVGVPREQVDGRRAVEREGGLVDERAQGAVRPRER